MLFVTNRSIKWFHPNYCKKHIFCLHSEYKTFPTIADISYSTKYLKIEISNDNNKKLEKKPIDKKKMPKTKRTIQINCKS